MLGELRDALRELREDLRGDLDRAQTETNRRLDEINAHLRVLNGRVGKGEEDRARIDESLKNLGREVFRRRSTDQDEANPTKRWVTERDVRMVAVGASGVLGALAFAWKVLPLLLKALTP